ncbi:hypothetical protein F66182_5494 [Fusarium sp. NRRL 66182]|nr:hypothetical protein F66182_5494 [Fusarium sp. NRRL 66182]
MIMYSLTVLMTALTALTAAQPTRPNSATLSIRQDDFLGKPTCPTGAEFEINKEDAWAGAEGFKLWIEQGADGMIDLSGNFKGQLSKTHGGVTFFACDYKSGQAGSYINGNLVQSVLRADGYLDSKCGAGRAGYERSNDLSIGRTFAYGPLIDEWPDDDTIQYDFNDYNHNGTKLGKIDYDDSHRADDPNAFLPAWKPIADPWDRQTLRASGPLMTAASALFRNTSFLTLVAKNMTEMNPLQTVFIICQRCSDPEYRNDMDFADVVSSWFDYFERASCMREAYFTRLVLVSLLLSGLAILVWFVNSHPTWT